MFINKTDDIVKTTDYSDILYRFSCKVMQSFAYQNIPSIFYNYKMQIHQRSFSQFADEVLVQVVNHFQVENGKKVASFKFTQTP
jgi:hypothetical protein